MIFKKNKQKNTNIPKKHGAYTTPLYQYDKGALEYLSEHYYKLMISYISLCKDVKRLSAQVEALSKKI